MSQASDHPIGAMSSTINQPQMPSPGMMSDKSWPAQDYNTRLLQECYQSVSELQAALGQLDAAGTHLTRSLVHALENTTYKCVSDVLTDRLRDVFTTSTSKTNVSLLKDMESMLLGLQNTQKSQMNPQLYGQTLCHTALLFIKLKKQYFTLGHSRLADLIHCLLCLKGEDPASAEVTKLVLKLGLADGLDSPSKSNTSLPSTPWGSPKLRKARPDSSKAQGRTGFRILSLFERKTPPDERKSSFYVDVEEPRGEKQEPQREGIPTVSVTAGSHEEKSYLPGGPVLDPFSGSLIGMGQGQMGPSGQGDLIQFKSVVEDTSVSPGSSVPIILSSRSQLATEEELESVINLLSGVGCGPASPMQVIPEVVPTQGPMQLTVPQIYRTASPASDTQLDDLRKAQVHRRSEGCLDLSAVGRNMWPHQHQYHHRASLPSVQIFSASGHRSGFDPPSPVPPYIRDSPSPNYGMRDPPSPGYFRGDPPSPFRTQYASTLGVGMGGLRPNMLSPLQWSTCPPSSMSSGSRFSYLDPGMAQHGTWPMYGGTSSVSPSAGDGSSWGGAQDCSDLSDDSSTEDQFFAVGKDLSHMLSSKDGSSDEEGETGQAKGSSIWPPPAPQTSVSPNRGTGATDLLEPPELYQTHRPIQMQWSDPLSSSSLWQSTPQESSQQKSSQSMQGFGGAPPHPH